MPDTASRNLFNVQSCIKLQRTDGRTESCCVSESTCSHCDQLELDSPFFASSYVYTATNHRHGMQSVSSGYGNAIQSRYTFTLRRPPIDVKDQARRVWESSSLINGRQQQSRHGPVGHARPGESLRKLQRSINRLLIHTFIVCPAVTFRDLLLCLEYFIIRDPSLWAK
jgi:hypothetical protein